MILYKVYLLIILIILINQPDNSNARSILFRQRFRYALDHKSGKYTATPPGPPGKPEEVSAHAYFQAEGGAPPIQSALGTLEQEVKTADRKYVWNRDLPGPVPDGNSAPHALLKTPLGSDLDNIGSPITKIVRRADLPCDPQMEQCRDIKPSAIDAGKMEAEFEDSHPKGRADHEQGSGKFASFKPKPKSGEGEGEGEGMKKNIPETPESKAIDKCEEQVAEGGEGDGTELTKQNKEKQFQATIKKIQQAISKVRKLGSIKTLVKKTFIFDKVKKAKEITKHLVTARKRPFNETSDPVRIRVGIRTACHLLRYGEGEAEGGRGEGEGEGKQIKIKFGPSTPSSLKNSATGGGEGEGIKGKASAKTSAAKAKASGKKNLKVDITQGNGKMVGKDPGKVPYSYTGSSTKGPCEGPDGSGIEGPHTYKLDKNGKVPPGITVLEQGSPHRHYVVPHQIQNPYISMNKPPMYWNEMIPQAKKICEKIRLKYPMYPHKEPELRDKVFFTPHPAPGSWLYNRQPPRKTHVRKWTKDANGLYGLRYAGGSRTF